MRIIAGKFKGRKLEVPKTDLRPTLDRTKETLFNILQFDIQDKNVLDLFAGSGCLGLEALSRGAKKAVFVDSDREAARVIKLNCEKCRCGDEAAVINMPFETALNSIKEKFHIVFVDPPYKDDVYFSVLKKLNNSQLLAQDAIVVCEHSRDDTLPNNVNSLSKYRVKEMGKCAFSFYQNVGDEQ
jgi:16S rRNA (guanine966-N2)-methyltransferase